MNLLETTKPEKKGRLLREISEMISENVTGDNVKISGNYKHILTHQVILAKFVLIKLRKFPESEDRNLKFYSFEKISDLPKPVLINRFLTDYKKLFS
jgi:A/G-specific adenine glycosylase